MQLSDRLQAVTTVLELSESFETAKAKLRAFPWNYEGPEVIMTRGHVANLLRRFLDGEIGAGTVVDWADLLEMREDLDFEEEDRDWLTNVLSELSNPYTNGELTRERAMELLVEAEA